MENLKNLHTLLAETQGEIESWTKFLEEIAKDKTLGVDVKFRVHQEKNKVEIDDDEDDNPFSIRVPLPFGTMFSGGLTSKWADESATEWARIDDALVYYISAFVVEKLKATRKELIKQISELA